MQLGARLAGPRRMPTQRQVAFWFAALVGLLFALYLVRDILLPFVAGLALAYMLDPIADRFQRLGMGRLAATLLILVLFILLFVLMLVLIVPLVVHQLQSFIGHMPEYIARLQALAADKGGPLLERIGGPDALQDMQSSVGDLVKQGGAWFGGFLRGLWSGGQGNINVFALIVGTPGGAFYFLVDWGPMGRRGRRWVPPRQPGTRP